MIDLPPKRCSFVSLYFEIEKAEHFDYDSIHVIYRVFLPHRCELLDGDLRGATHSSERNRISGQWLIGHCHELHLLCQPDFDCAGRNKQLKPDDAD